MASALTFDLHGMHATADNLRAARGELYAAYARAARGEGGQAIAAAMRNNAPRRTGLFAQSIDVRTRGVRGADVGTHRYDSGVQHPRDAAGRRGAGMRMSSIGWFIESGTAAHPNKGKFTGSTHPGTRAQRVASRALRSSAWELEAATLDELDRGRWKGQASA